ncbi:helitron_like_N domain-containing protein [Trichonephila clavipes]|nr:helitron_like_N domain-containing protein [Trichonephila clavipes]
MLELKQQVFLEGHEASENFTMYIIDDRLDFDQHRGRYNAPKTNKVAMEFKISDRVPPNNWDICISVIHRLMVEGNRLNFLRPNQRTLRVESYLGLPDLMNALASEAGMRAGVILILPLSFSGSPRAMQQNFQDAMSVVRDFGKPDLFLNYSCNPKWKEIKDNLFSGQKSHDRPDLIARVFDIKNKALLQDLKEKMVFLVA